MARAKKSQSDVTTASEGISMILDTPVQKPIDEAAKFVGCAEIRLLEMFSERLEAPEVMIWESVPIEHEALLSEFKQQQEAFNSVRALEPEMQEANPAQAEAPVQEPPILQDEPEAPKAKQSKRKSSALTKGKTKEITNTKEDTKQTNRGINETLTLLQAKEAVVDSSQDATAYLATYATNLTNLKGEGLNYFAAQSMQKISQASGFSPEEIMRQVGVPLAAETQAKLNETMAQVLGKSQAAMEEILETTWGNGYNLQAELSRLDNLMNSDD